VIPDWRRTWATWKRPLGLALAVTIVLRVITTVIALDATYGSSFPHVVARTPSVLVNVWAHWDTGYYIFIAQHGYPAATAAQLHARTIPIYAAFGPAYPWIVRLTHTVLPFGWVASTQIVSAVATVVALIGIVHLTDRVQNTLTSNASIMLLVAFPTAFFLLAGYPDSLALCLLVWTFIAARRGNWLLVGLGAALTCMTVFYLGIVVIALVFEIWQARPAGEHWPEGWTRDGLRIAMVSVPTALFLAVWIIICDHLDADPFAFERAQAIWGRHFAFPWTLAHRTLSDLVHLRFLDTSTASVMELFDSVTVVMLAVVTVVVFVKVRRSYGVLLGSCLCVFTFQTILYSETREVLVLFPLFIGLGSWVAGHPWRERVVLCLFVPSAYYLTTRFVTGAFAG
jgi:hypothetical protein